MRAITRSAGVEAVGQVAILRFPQADLVPGKPRPVLLLAQVPGRFDDWLACMVSTQLHQGVEGFDEVVAEADDDFAASGLKTPSVIRVGRLAVVQSELLLGSVGRIGPGRLVRIRDRLAEWILRG